MRRPSRSSSRDRLGIPIENVVDRPWRHRQGAVRHGHLRLALGRGRHVGHRQGARQGRSPRARRSRPMCWRPPTATSSSRTATSPSRAPTRRSISAQVALQAYIAHKFSGQELEPGLKEGAFYDPTNFTFPAGVHICEVEVDPETGSTRDRSLDGGRRFRHRHQPDDRRGPGAWRHRAGRRPGAARRGALRRGRASSSRRATWITPCRAPTTCRPSRRHDGHALPVQPAGHQGLRRSGRDRARRRPSSTPSRTRSATRMWPMPATPQASCWQKPAQRARQQAAPPNEPSTGEQSDVRIRLSPRRTALRGAASALAKHEDGKLLAGGQTLLPTMKQRLAEPSALIDLGAIERSRGHRARRAAPCHRRHDHACRRSPTPTS